MLNRILQCFNQLAGLVFLVCPLVLILLSSPVDAFGLEQRSKVGYVMARTVITDEDGEPILVEYNDDGTEAGIVDVGLPAAKVSIVSAAQFRAQRANLESYRAINKYGLARHARLLSRKEYEATQLLASDQTTVIEKPALPGYVKSVLIKGQPDRLPGFDDFDDVILQQFSVDLTQSTVIPENIKSLVLNGDGQVLDMRPGSIGPRTGYFGSSHDDIHPYGTGFQPGKHKAYGAIVGQPVTLFPMRGAGVTDQNGMFAFRHFVHCMPWGFWTKNVLETKLYYSAFTPRGASVLPFYMSWNTEDYCMSVPNLGPTLMGQMAEVAITGILAAQSTPLVSYPLLVDVMSASGAVDIRNPDGSSVTIGDTTEYVVHSPENAPVAQASYDFDQDGQPDISKLGVIVQQEVDGEQVEVFTTDTQGAEPDKQGIWFSSNADLSGPPDVVRLADNQKNFGHTGFLKSLSKQDLQNTDILVFRESTGELIVSRNGLSDAEAGKSNTGLIGDQFYYRLSFLGRRGAAFSVGADVSRYEPFEEWTSSNGFTKNFVERQSNHLKPGEWINIVAINRATGYMGNVKIPLQDLNQSMPVPQITLYPPNIKIWAERKYDVEQGLTAGQERNYLISSEGAGLTSDTEVAVYTEWFDYAGLPLPAGLGADNGEMYGLSGRLAKIVAPNLLADASGSQLANFSIAPGRQTQILKFAGEAPDHFYIHVSGTALDDGPDFDTVGAGEEQLQTRPASLTPFKVPLLDESKSNKRMLVYNQQKKIYEEAEDNSGLINPEKPSADYRWVYRPEYQFSRFKFDISSIEAGDSQDIRVENLLNQTRPTITSMDELINVFYSLDLPEYERLSSIDGGQTFVFSVGAGEAEITVTPDGQLQFSESMLTHLSSLEPEDFLTMSLVLNEDSANVLWEYAFEYLFVEPLTIGYDNQTEETYYVTADEPTVELKSTVAGFVYRDPSVKQTTRLRWIAAGGGTFEEPVQQSVDTGIFDNTLVMSTVKGSQAEVSVELLDGEGPTYWKQVEVLAGKAHRIATTRTGQAVAHEQGEVRVDVVVYDQFNNRVEDGTPVTFDFADSFNVVEQQVETVNGEAFIVLTGGEFQVSDATLTVSSGDVTATEQISSQKLNVELLAETTLLSKQQTVSVSALVRTQSGKPAANVPVSFTANKGLFAEQYVLTDAAGIATVNFTGGLNEVIDTWRATAGFAGGAELEYSVRTVGPKSIDALDTMLVADESQDGDISFDELGNEVTLGYRTRATVNVRSDVATTVQLGDMADPNLEPLLSLPMNSIDWSNGLARLLDDHQLNPANAKDVTVVHDHPLGAGRSTRFYQADADNSGSQADISNITAFNLTKDIGFRLDVKPLSDGTIFDHAKGTQRLSYSGDTLRFEVKTDQGNFTVSAAGVGSNEWHRVATRVTASTVELYVDGQVYSEPLQGGLLYEGVGLKIGGLDAVMRGFRLYDWSSQPLITFADGQTTADIEAGDHTLSVNSLGNLGKRLPSSQLNTMRVAIINGDQRNFASLLTKQGYQAISQDYLRTASPQTPYAYQSVSNPFPALVPTAHALWTWAEAWEAAKESISYIIPYEDFIIVGEQLLYLAEGSDEFDASKLTFAALGAATVVPIAKPLKPVLTPLKKMVDGLKRFPASRHVAGAVGTAVKAGLNGKTDKLADLLPFMLIAMELYEDQEVFEFMMSAIESEDDLWVWIDYIAAVVEAEGGLDELASYSGHLNSQETAIAANPLSFFVASAYAKTGKTVGGILITRIREVTKSIDLQHANKVSKALRVILKDPELKKIAASGTSALRVFAAVGGTTLAQFVRQSKNWRVNRWLVLFSMVYLVEEADAKRFNISNDSQFTSLVSHLFSKNKSNYNGAVFQIVQTAYFHARHQAAGSSMPRVAGIDTVRPAHYLANGVKKGEAYKRRVDIVLEHTDGKEEWVELKSYAASTVSSSARKSDNALEGTKVLREFFHDYRLNDGFITNNDEYRNEILIVGSTTNKLYTWLFHKFSVPKGADNKAGPPTEKRIESLRKRLCRKPEDVESADYKYNFNSHEQSVISAKCEKAADKRVELRDTGSYFTEVLDIVGTPFALALKNELMSKL